MPDREVAILTELTATVSAPDGRANVTGAAGTLLDALAPGKYVAIVADPERSEAEGRERDASDGGRAGALIALAQALNARTRCALVLLRGGGNRTGADACLTSHTGYPMAIDFARGVPGYRPFEAAAERLARGNVDALLVVGSAAQLPQNLLDHLPTDELIVIGPGASATSFAAADVIIDTGVVGIHEEGTALRMDDVPLPLSAILPGLPTAHSMVERLRRRLFAIAKPLANQR